VRISISGSASDKGEDKIMKKARVEYQDQEISGIIIIKPIDNEEYKVAFISDLGMTYLEGVLKNDQLEIENIIPVLDHKSFLKKFIKSITSNF